MESLGPKAWRWYLAGGGALAVVGLGIWLGATSSMATTPPTVISGRVRAPTGQPVAQARVYFVQGPDPLPDVAALTGADGGFALAAPVAGSYELGCSAEGFAGATIAVHVAAGPLAPVEIRLRH